jgi:PAS domain S-box-containing protein
MSISIERKRAEQKLKLLDRAIDQSSVSIVITNRDGLIEYTNPKFTETSGYSAEEAMGKNPRILKSGKHSDEFYELLWKTLTSGKVWNGEICNKRKNGTFYWENVYISPVEGEDGQISHYVGIKEDINEKKLLEETQRITLEISQISITKTSLNSFLKEVHKHLNKIMRANNFYVALYDQSTDTYTLEYHIDDHDKFETGKPLKLSNGYTDLVRKTGIAQLITQGMRNDPENQIKAVGYGETPSAWLGVPLKTSTESEAIGVIAIQDYKNLNAYTKLEQHTLEVIAKDICIFIERIKNLEDITKAKERAEESDRLKSAFLANMSHEIRTPLNSIVGFSDLLLDPDFDRNQYAEFAKIISSSGNSLLAIISDIMDISKIEAGQIKVVKTRFSVMQLIREIQKQYSFTAIEKGLDLKIITDIDLEELVIESDVNKLRQILVNFVGNAIKFTSKGFVEIGATTKNSKVLFHVKDTGIGIPKEYHTEIFDRFRQIEDADTRKYGGNGLGLAISKSLIELLGGQIGIESESGQGSKFYFTLPIKTKELVT